MTSKELLITDRKAVIEAAGKTVKDVKADIKIIRDWFKTQPHLPEVPNDNMIEHFLVTNKFSIERTKQRLDMYYTIRTLIPEFYVDRNPLSPNMQDINKMGIFVPLPKLTKELYRVYIMKIEGQPEDFDTYKYFANALNIIEMRVQYDLSLGDIYIIDYTNLKMGHVVKMTPTHFKKAITVSEKVFSNRIKGIHLVYSPSYIDTLMNIGKALLKPKIFGRIHNHANIEEIYKFIPKDVLPKNYGGEERSVEELNGDTMIEMFLATNKFSVERTKEKLDMYYTIRTRIPEIYENSNPKSQRMKDVSDMVTFVALPKPTKEHYRVFITKIKGPVEDFNSDKFFAHALNLIEVRLQHDIALGDVYIFDHEHLKVGHVLKMTPIHLKKIVTIFEKVFSNRIKGLYAINYPAYVDMLMTFVKATAKPKLVNRVKFFPNIEDMYEFVPREILPRDYGGEEVSVSELEDLWRKELENHSERFDKLDTMKVREELRPVPLKNDELLGYHGNFKKLDVD